MEIKSVAELFERCFDGSSHLQFRNLGLNAEQIPLHTKRAITVPFCAIARKLLEGNEKTRVETLT